MASLTNTKIKNTYVSLLKVADNGQLDAALQDITDGAGNVTGVQLNTGGDLAASGTVSFGSLKDTGENITISKFVDAVDGIGSNNNDTTIPTSAAVVSYVASQVTLEDLDFAGDSGTGAVDLDSQTLTIQGTANEIETVASNQTLTIGLPSTINVNVSGNLTGTVTSASVLQDGVTATTQTIGDNSTKVATTAYVDAAITAENLDIAGTSGTGSVDLDSQTLTIAGTTNEIETVASGQTITVGLPSDVTIGNNLTVTTNATVGGTFGVTGATGVDGDFDVNTNKFNVQAATGNTSVAGTFGVTGNTTLSTVDVTGLASLDGGIDVDGAFTVADTSGNISTSGTLGVTGTSTLGVINASGLASLDAGIDVDGVFTVADTTGNVSTTGTLTAGATTINGLLDVVGEVQGTFLDINGNGEVSGNLAVDTDTLFVDSTNDRVGVNKTNPAVALDVTGDITSSGTITGTTLAGTLSTAAQPNITSVGTLSSLTVSGALNGTLSTAAQPNVTSVGTLSSLAVSGNVTIDSTTLSVDSSNNRVGIGTSSPTHLLQLYADSLPELRLGDATTQIQMFTNTDAFFGTVGAHNLIFTTAATERMRIDSSGNVSIKAPTASGGGVLNLENTDTAVNGQNWGSVNFISNDSSAGASGIRASIVGTSTSFNGDGNLVFSTAPSNSALAERMRIDSSGNILMAGATGVGATGVAVYSSGAIEAARANNIVTYLNRTGSDGDILQFRNDGSVAGSIGASGSELYINFGGSTGGTVTSRTLDDYEEGTWTPVIRGSGTAGTYEIASHYSTYTKVGRLVTLSTYITLDDPMTGGGSGYLQITGAPFTKAANTFAAGAVPVSGFDFTGAYLVLQHVTLSATNILYLNDIQDDGTNVAAAISGLSAGDRIAFTISFEV